MRELSISSTGATFGELLFMSIGPFQSSIPSYDVLKFGNDRLKEKKRDLDDARGSDNKRAKYGPSRGIGGWSPNGWQAGGEKGSDKGDGGVQARKSNEPRKGAGHVFAHYKKQGDIVSHLSLAFRNAGGLSRQ